MNLEQTRYLRVQLKPLEIEAFSTREVLFLICHGGSDSKESACNAGDQGWIAVSGRSPEGDAYPLQ